MRCANVIFLLSIFFTLCLHGAVCSRQWLRNTGKVTINNRHLHIGGRDRTTTSVAKTSSAGVRVTTRSSNAQAQVEYRRYGHNPAKYSKKNFVFATGLPLLRHSTHADNDISKPISSKNSTAVDANMAYIRVFGGDYDTVPGTKYLCASDGDCISLLQKSFCGYDNYCICIYPMIFDGETCHNPDSIHECSAHKDCGGIEGSRCVLVETTGRKICKCEPHTIFDVYRCLPEAGFLDDCISDRQCQNDLSCYDGVCRTPCDVGEVWKFDRCVDEFPRIKPSIKNTSFPVDPAILFGIIGGIPLFILSTALALLLRRRYVSQQSSATNSVSSSTRNSQPTARSSYDSTGDRPPSYDEAMTASTLTLPTNAEEMCEDLPPSYRSWEEAQGVHLTLQRR